VSQHNYQHRNSEDSDVEGNNRAEYSRLLFCYQKFGNTVMLFLTLSYKYVS